LTSVSPGIGVQKQHILEECVTATAYARKYAQWLLNHSEEVLAPPTALRRRYGRELKGALVMAWKTLNRICAKRLTSFLPSIVATLEQHGHLQLSEEHRSLLLSMSAATAGWTECLPTLNRGREAVLAALQRARTRFPFPILGIDTDNGAEFINEEVAAYCVGEQITFTRGRPYEKRDQCFVEQKNGTVVRQVVGYGRLMGEQAYRQLDELYRALHWYVNCFQPSMKLVSAQVEGRKIHRSYDAAKTPMQRVLLSGVLSPS
jgi:hypothetical protein